MRPGQAGYAAIFTVMNIKTSKPIGEINGGWGVLFKMSLACFPVVLVTAITWGTWVTHTIIETKEQQKNTVTLVELLRREELQEVARRDDMERFESKMEKRQVEILNLVQRIRPMGPPR